MTPTSSIAIAICTHNRAVSLERTLHSVLAEVMTSSIKDDPRCEIIVIDNASKDDTEHRVRALQPRESRLRYVYEPTLGLSAARNRAIRESGADILLFLDDDVTVEPGLVDAHLQPYGLDERCVAVGGAITLAFETRHPWWLGPRLAANLAEYPLERDVLRPLTSPHNPPFGANMSFLREPLAGVGGFDPKLGRMGTSLISGEETTVFLALLDQGWTVWLSGSARVLHHIPESRTKFRWIAARRYAQGRTEQRIDNRYGAGESMTRLVFGGLRYLVRHRSQPLVALAEYATQRCYWAGRLIEQLATRRPD